MTTTEDLRGFEKIKVSPESDTSNKINNNIIADLSENINNLTVETISSLVKKDIWQMPKIYEKTFKMQSERFENWNKDLLLIQVLQAFSYSVTERRVKTCIVEGFSDYSFAPNMFTIIQANSGSGKDYPQNMIFENIIKNEKWENAINSMYNENILKRIEAEANLQKFSKTEDREKFINDQRLKKIRTKAPTRKLERGTFEGLRELAKYLDIANIGSLFFQSSEFGKYLQTQQGEQEIFFNTIYEGFYGKIAPKHTKGDLNKNSEDIREIENCFINVELHTTDEPFKNKATMQKFREAVETGLLRRSFLLKFNIEDFDDICTIEKTQNYAQSCKEIREKYLELFEAITPNSKYKITKEVQEFIRPKYQEYLFNKRATLDDTLKQYLKSRDEKAYKMALAFACYNHPREHLITPLDYLQAITTIEHIDRTFKQFFNVKKDSIFDKVAKEIMNNLQPEKTISKGELYTLCKPLFDNDIRKTKEFFNGKNRDNKEEYFSETIDDLNGIFRGNNLQIIKVKAERNQQLYTLKEISNSLNFDVNEVF